ncbi:fasciclin-like arabinogalactan protein 8 [Brassica napus]|uniref:fasciclin-like arabinogalactan protein 8 n=1 Tax=Brassica napus TaxID=3708 RepID=UPI00207A7730|nr:fasciclin-like arabinogalactan protein 8 [Brassica napus]
MAAPLLAFIFSLLAIASTVRGYNITKILANYPDYSSFNSYLSQTKLAEEINSYPTITLLALNNDAMASFAGKRQLSVVKKVLSLLTLLDYYDPESLHQISEGTTLSVTLYNNTAGNAPEYLGYVNITDLYGGQVAFGSAVSGSKLDSYFTKSVKQIPYSISVVEIDAPIIAPGILAAPAPSPANITGLLENAGCKTFAKMLAKSGVLKKYESVIKKGLTVFAPSDEAFKAKDVPDPTKLTKANMVSLLEYHALAHYKPKGSLKSNKNKVSTLATTGAGNFDLTTSTSGDEVVLHTGIASSRLVHTVLDATPVVIFTVDNVLLPTELFGNSHSPAPVPALSPAEGASPTAPSPSEPPTDESPESSHSNSSKGLANSKSANAAVAVSSPSLFTALVTLATIAVFQLVETF